MNQSYTEQLPDGNFAQRLEDLVARIDHEFERVSDYIWKAPRLIDQERALELKKLDAYFPNDPELRARRWGSESHKLEHTFPYLIATGNLFSLLSLFESYVLLLADELQSHTGLQIKEQKGQGVSRLLKYLKATGIMVDQTQLNEQVSAALKIRNCLMHASGMLDWSKENEGLRHIQRSGGYLSPKHRGRRIKIGRKFDEVLIVSSPFGDRVIISNSYCHVLCGYIKDYLVELCNAANSIPGRPT